MKCRVCARPISSAPEDFCSSSCANRFHIAGGNLPKRHVEIVKGYKITWEQIDNDKMRVIDIEALPDQENK